MRPGQHRYQKARLCSCMGRSAMRSPLLLPVFDRQLVEIERTVQIIVRRRSPYRLGVRPTSLRNWQAESRQVGVAAVERDLRDLCGECRSLTRPTKKVVSTKCPAKGTERGAQALIELKVGGRRPNRERTDSQRSVETLLCPTKSRRKLALSFAAALGRRVLVTFEDCQRRVEDRDR
jgi:hypothetical protein